MTRLSRHLFSCLTCAAVLLPSAACKNQASIPTDQPDIVRVEGVNEPPELLIPGEKPLIRTKDIIAFGTVLDGMKAGNEAAVLPAVDAFIAAHPQFGEAYPIRATLRCQSGDLQGARKDLETAMSGVPQFLKGAPETARTELLATHAKLAFMAHDDATTSHDLHELIESYSSDIPYLTDGRVKTTDKGQSPCGWTAADITEWLRRSGNTPDSQVFQLMFVASHAPLDDAAKSLTAKYAGEIIRANPAFAPAYFYAAVGAQKISAFKQIAFSDAERDAYNDRLIGLWSSAIRLNPSIQKAYAERAESYLQRKNYPNAIDDYDHAIALSPNDSGLWNDRGLAKQETYDKSGAITDFTQAANLQRQSGEFEFLPYSLENRGDLYVKLGDYSRALDDYSSLIAVKLHNNFIFLNLAFIRKLYPQYATVDDPQLKAKLHRMLVPNWTDKNFDAAVMNPAGLQPSMDGGLRDVYLKRADVLLALKRSDAARQDYSRAELFKERQEDDRWRTPPGLNGIAIDLRTLEVDTSQVKVWVKPPKDDKQTTEPQPTRFSLDCKRHTVQMGDKGGAHEPIPGSYAEIVRDYFCPSQ